MSKTDVAPPPINVPVVNPANGMPTRALTDFLYRIWERTGGGSSSLESVMNLLAANSQRGGTASSGSTVQQDAAQIVALIETLITRQSAEIAELRKELNALSLAQHGKGGDLSNEALAQANTATALAMTPKSDASAQEAKQEANSAQAVLFMAAMGRTIPYP